MSTDTAGTTAGYTEDNLKTLKDAAHIRQNPGMYVGNTQSAGLHHLVYEIVYNSVDEWLAGPGAGLTTQARDDLAAMFRAYDRNGLVGEPDTLTRLLGRASRTWEQTLLAAPNS